MISTRGTTRTLNQLINSQQGMAANSLSHWLWIEFLYHTPIQRFNNNVRFVSTHRNGGKALPPNLFLSFPARFEITIA
jgi:hypothetical protein